MKSDEIKAMIDSTIRSQLNENFEAIILGEFVISIQGGVRCYSEPSEDFHTLHSYKKFEIAIFDKSRVWVSPRKDDRLKDFKWAEAFEDNNSKPIAAFVDRNKLEQIMEDLLSLTSRCMN